MYKKLALSIILDLIGLIPIPFFDYVWAPIAGYIMIKMYKGYAGKIAGFIGFLEEILPFTDFLPTFTIMWLYEFFLLKNKEDSKPMI